MSIRALIDESRLSFVQDDTLAPTRAVVYTPIATAVPHTLNAFVGLGLFNKIERETIGRYQSFGGLQLTATPDVLDTVTYDGVVWKVVRFTKMGALYTVICENTRHNGRPRA